MVSQVVGVEPASRGADAAAVARGSAWSAAIGIIRSDPTLSENLPDRP